jgi:hypothetical protein
MYHINKVRTLLILKGGIFNSLRRFILLTVAGCAGRF